MTTNENLKLTIDEFRQIKGCERVEEKQALQVIETMYMMSILAFNAYNKEQKSDVL
jgi:hypothetical protein